jgi:LuxR family maltose regulon positive regulatory protein
MADTHPQRLVDRMLSGGRLVVLCAPPGFHKAQLARKAAQQFSENSGRVMHWLGALEHGRNPTAAIDLLLSDLPRVLVIEGSSPCDGVVLAQALERAVRHGPAHKIFLLIAQANEIPLARLTSVEPPDVLDAASLRVRKSDKDEALLGLRPKVRNRIGQLAGDWPIALALLTRWASSTTTSIDSWSDLDILRESGLSDFIAQEVVNQFTPDEMVALSYACFLNESELGFLSGLNAPIRIDRILANLAFRLKGLLDRSENRISIQPALRAYLRELTVMPDGRDRLQVMMTLADHCASKGRLGEAALLARMAGRAENIASYANKAGAFRIWVTQGFSVLKELVAQAGTAVLSASAALRMMECIVFLKSGKVRVAQKIFEELAVGVGPDALIAPDLEILRVTLMVYGCSLEREGDLQLLKQLILEQGDDPSLGTFLATLSCVLNSQQGNFDIAAASLIDARVQAKKASSAYNLMFLDLHEASIYSAQGKLTQARASVAEARRIWKAEFSDDVGVETVVAALSATIEFEAGQLVSARNAVKRSALRMPDAEAWFDIYFAAYEPMIRLHVSDHGLGTTIEVIDTESRKLRAQGLPRVADLLLGIGFCLAGEAAMRGGDDVIPSHWNAPNMASTSSWQEKEVFNLARAYELNRKGDRKAGIDLLRNGKTEAQRLGLERSRLRYLLLEFALSSTESRVEYADCPLREALAIGARTGMRQVFRECANDRLISALGELLIAPNLDDLERSFVCTVLNKLREPAVTGTNTLSTRELEVLRFLVVGGSDKHLARQLNISEHGVRYHLKSLFKKLGVHDRVSAIAQSRRLGLMD